MRPHRRHASRLTSRGATLVEFALTAPLFFFLVFAVFAGAWYVLEVSAVTNATREAVRWEIATSNFNMTEVPPVPWCAYSGGPNVPAAMVQAAKTTAGPFASEITSAAITNTTTDGGSSCTITLVVPYLPLVSVLPGLPDRVSSTFTSTVG